MVCPRASRILACSLSSPFLPSMLSHRVISDLIQAEEALRVAEEAVAVSRIAALERRAKPVRRASRAVKARGMAGGLRQVCFNFSLTRGD